MYVLGEDVLKTLYLIATHFVPINPLEIELLSVIASMKNFGTKSASAIYTFLRSSVPPLSFCTHNTFSSITADHHHFQSQEDQGKIKEMVCMNECMCGGIGPCFTEHSRQHLYINEPLLYHPGLDDTELSSTYHTHKSL